MTQLSSTQTALERTDQQRRSELTQMTWPMLIGVLSLMSFQLADSYFISKLGTDPLAVVGFTIPMYQLIIGFQVGIGIATTALISQLIGSKNLEGANTLGTQILLFGSLVIGSICMLIWLFRAEVLLMLGGKPELLPLIDDFWAIWLTSALCGAVVYFGYSICRAHGNTKLPGTMMVFTSLLNIVLDPLFIFYFDMNLAGAAYASLASFFIGGLIIYPKIVNNHWLSLSRFSTTLSESFRRITAIAAPAMMSQMLPAAAAMLSTAIVASYGIEAVAAWGMGVRVEFFGLVMILALTMSLPPMIGKEFGARNYPEISALIDLAVKRVLVIQTIFAIVLLIFATPLSQILSPEDEVADYLSLYLMVIPFSYGPLGVCMIMVSSANAVSQAMRALAISFARLFICYIPFLWIGSLIGGFQGIVIGAAVGNVLAGIIAWKAFERGRLNWQ